MPLLAKTYTPDINPAKYYISEKLCGLRALWDGKNLVSRNNNIYPVPKWFTESFPTNIPLDGELWIDRNSLEETSSIVRSGRVDKGWGKIIYCTFDIPEPRAGYVEERWEALKTIVHKTNVKHLKYVPQMVCSGKEQLFQLLDLVVSKSSEGLMLRKPKSHYENKRSDTLLKVKPYFDAEATVIAHEESEIITHGKAHLVGSMGALLCRTDSGAEFKVGTGFSDYVRLNPPPVGSRITYKYNELSKSGIPRTAVFVRVRDVE